MLVMKFLLKEAYYLVFRSAFFRLADSTLKALSIQTSELFSTCSAFTVSTKICYTLIQYYQERTISEKAEKVKRVSKASTPKNVTQLKLYWVC